MKWPRHDFTKDFFVTDPKLSYEKDPKVQINDVKNTIATIRPLWLFMSPDSIWVSIV